MKTCIKWDGSEEVLNAIRDWGEVTRINDNGDLRLQSYLAHPTVLVKIGDFVSSDCEIFTVHKPLRITAIQFRGYNIADFSDRGCEIYETHPSRILIKRGDTKYTLELGDWLVGSTVLDHISFTKEFGEI